MDEYSQPVALPKLIGAPAYARPAIAVAHTPRPLDPDDLPIVAEMGPDELALLAALPAPAGRAAPRAGRGLPAPGGPRLGPAPGPRGGGVPRSRSADPRAGVGSRHG